MWLIGIRALREQASGVRFGWALVTPATLLGLSLTTYAVASRFLEPAEFGRFVVAMSVLGTLVPMASLGVPVILIRHFAGSGEREPPSALRNAAYLTILLESLLIISLATVTDRLLGPLLGQWLSAGLAPLVAVGAAATALSDLRVSQDQASLRFRQQFGGVTGAASTRLAGVVLAMALAPLPDHRTAVTGYVAGAVLSALFMARSELVSALRNARKAAGFVRDDFVRRGLPIAASGILGVLTVHIDTLIAASLLAPADLAQYAVATRLSLIHVTAIGGLTTLALPVAATLARRGSLDTYAQAVTRLGLPLGTVAVLFSIVLAPFAVDVLFGDLYRPSVMVFVVLSLGFALNYAGNPLSQVLYITHRAHILVLVQLGLLVTFMILAGFAAPRWGPVGLAAARTVSNLLAVGIVGVVSIGVARRLTAQAHAAPDE